METLFKLNAKHGSLERARANEITDRKIFNVLNRVITTPGLVVTKNIQGVVEDDWTVAKKNSTQVTVQPGEAIFKDSNDNLRFADLAAVETLDLPITASTSGNLYLTISYLKTNYEKGTITLTNGSDQVVGVGTEFAKILAANRRIFVDGIAYKVASVESALALTLESSYTGTTNEDTQFKVGAWFTSYPSGESDNMIYEYDDFEFVIKANSYLSTDIVLAKISVVNGVISTVTDMRALSLLNYRTNSDFGSKHNLVRNGSFIRPNYSDYGPWRSSGGEVTTRRNTTTDSVYAGGYLRLETDADNGYAYIGQKIRLTNTQRQATEYTLGLEIGCEDISKLASFTISVYAWTNSQVKLYSTINASKGLSETANRVFHRDLISEGVEVNYTQGLKIFPKFSVPNGVDTLFLQIRLADEGDEATYIEIDNIMLVEGDQCPYFAPHPEDYIELREIGRAAYLINELFEIGQSGKVLLKKDIYGLKNPNSTDDATSSPILDASTTIANTNAQATSGTQEGISQYNYYDDDLE